MNSAAKEYKKYLIESTAYQILQDLLKTLYKERPQDPLQLIVDVMSDQEWTLLRAKKDKLTKQVSALLHDNSELRLKLLKMESDHEEVRAAVAASTSAVPTTRGSSGSAAPTTRVPSTNAVPTTRVPSTNAFQTTRGSSGSAVPTTRVPSTNAVPTTRVLSNQSVAQNKSSLLLSKNASFIPETWKARNRVQGSKRGVDKDQSTLIDRGRGGFDPGIRRKSPEKGTADKPRGG